MGYSGAIPIHTPLEQHINFTTKEYDEKFKLESNDKVLKDPTSYRNLIGKLTLTRPDLMFSVQSLSQFIHEPKNSYFTTAKRIIQHLKEV